MAPVVHVILRFLLLYFAIGIFGQTYGLVYLSIINNDDTIFNSEKIIYSFVVIAGITVLIFMLVSYRKGRRIEEIRVMDLFGLYIEFIFVFTVIYFIYANLFSGNALFFGGEVGSEINAFNGNVSIIQCYHLYENKGIGQYGDAGRDSIIALLYYSTMTQTTVGFGDIVGNDFIVRSMAIIQSLIGTFILVILIGKLAGQGTTRSNG